MFGLTKWLVNDNLSPVPFSGHPPSARSESKECGKHILVGAQGGGGSVRQHVPTVDVGSEREWDHTCGIAEAPHLLHRGAADHFGAASGQGGGAGPAPAHGAFQRRGAGPSGVAVHVLHPRESHGGVPAVDGLLLVRGGKGGDGGAHARHRAR